MTAACALLLTSPPAQAAPPGGAIGTWVNPHHSVKVATGACGAQLCGWVVWASPEAIADADAAGVHPLIGTALLQNYRPAGTGQWQGRVYVPDMGKTFHSTIRQLGANSLKISGCVLGGWLCKSQIWQRA